MKNSYSNIYTFNEKILNKLINSLKNGGVAGLPTETVYGLGGNAYLKKSVEKIFKLKGRPKNNPLIIHYHNLNDAKNDIEINNYLVNLYKKFCPGPITFILNRKMKSKIHPSACAKLNTVAVRFPKHRIVRTLLKKIKFPLAMPSANKSSGVSPVSPKDVFEEFKEKLKLIINGGICKIGIESTVIDLTGTPQILRPGIIDEILIEKTLKSKVLYNFKNKKIISPGMMKKHYSPGIPVLINQKKHDGKSAFIYLGYKHKHKNSFFSLSKKSNLKEAATNLYRIFRLIKRKGYKKIQICKIPNIGPGIAINDRVRKASKF